MCFNANSEQTSCGGEVIAKVPIVELGNTKSKVFKLDDGTYDLGTSPLNTNPKETVFRPQLGTINW